MASSRDGDRSDVLSCHNEGRRSSSQGSVNHRVPLKKCEITWAYEQSVSSHFLLTCNPLMLGPLVNGGYFHFVILREMLKHLEPLFQYL